MEIRPDEFEVEDYLGKTFECECGKKHSTELKRVIIKPGALKDIPALIKDLGCVRPMVICGANGKKAAGTAVNELLSQNGYETVFHVLESWELIPNEAALGEVLMAHEINVDIIVAVGTGTINDICKFLSFHMGIPYVAVATAPSMDGFASNGAALIKQNLKTTYAAHVPVAIVGDVDVLKNAPLNMITAGLGDIIGKYICLTDWKIAGIITDEYYCPTIVKMVQQSLDRVTENAAKVLQRDEEAVSAIMEALVVTGIAMSFAGNSRPASGSEHHISHYWEMKFQLEGRKPILHGTKVGIGTVLTGFIYNYLKDIKPDFEYARIHSENFDMKAWEKNISRTFMQAAPGVIALEHEVKKNSKETHAKRIELIEKKWDDIVEIIKSSVPHTDTIIEMLRSLNAPVFPKDIGIDSQTVFDSIIVAKEVRDRYTLLQLLWDLGIEEQIAGQLVSWLNEQEK